MDAILCVSARHYAYLQPGDKSYGRMAAHHLNLALSRFRQELSQNTTSMNLDAFVTTSFLFQLEVWTNPEFSDENSNSIEAYDPLRDGIFSFFASLKQVFLKVLPIIIEQRPQSLILPRFGQDIFKELFNKARISDSMLDRYRECFHQDRQTDLHLSMLPVSCEEAQSLSPAGPQQQPVPYNEKLFHEPNFATAIQMMCLLSAYSPESQPPEAMTPTSPLFWSLARSIFTFPIQARGEFTTKLQENNRQALLLLYHFYRTARTILPEKECWWAQQRAIASEKAIRKLFRQRGWEFMERLPDSRK